MTVRKIGVTVGDRGSALRAAQYSLEQADGPAAFSQYYTAEEAGLEVDRANVIWLGSASTLSQLGLERGTEVSQEQLASALQGRHAVTGEQLRRPGYRAVTVPGPGPGDEPRTVREARVNSVDLTFSAPKSVSVAWSQAGPELRRRIEQAMVVAANAGLEYMMATKPVVQGQRVPAHGFAASAALQVTARTAKGDRVPAPQLHVHGTVVAVEDDQGKLRTPDSAALFKHDAPLEGGAVARAVLAQELREIGFGIDAGTGRNRRFFEITGVPQGLAERMSPRAHEVERMVAQIEQATGDRLRGRELGAVAMRTRAAKSKELTATEIVAGWDAQAAEFEFGRAEVEALRDGRRPERSPEQVREAARATILARIREQGPTVSVGAARAIGFEVATLGLDVRAAAGLLAEMESEGELIALADGLVTTREIRAVEQAVLSTAVAAASRPHGGLSADAVTTGVAVAERALGPGRTLDPEQVTAVRALTAGAGWGTLTGLAGTGKGPVLQAVAEAHRADGWQVLAGAVDGSTAQRLGHQVDGEASTIEQLVYRIEHGSVRVDARTLILIEEASKVGLADWARLAGVAEAHGARIVGIGHAGQLGAIELPGMFEAMLRADAIPTAELTQIRRHRDPADPGREHPWLGDYQRLLDAGQGSDAVALLREHDAITMAPTRAEAIEQLVDRWDERRREYDDPRDAILIVHGANEDVDRVNELAQERRLRAPGPGRAPDLRRESVPAVDRPYAIHPGDVVMLREGAYRFDPPGDGRPAPRRLENGTIGIVDSVDPGRDRIRVEVHEPGVEPRLVEIDQARLRRQRQRGQERVAALRLAYAFHPFPLQGATVKDVGVLAGHWSQDKEGTYVADTRAELRLHVQLDRESLGTERTEEECWAQYAKRVRTPRGQRASIMWEESGEPVALLPPVIERAPDLPLRGKASDGPSLASSERAAGPSLAPSGRADGPAVDPLDAHRDVLGPERTRSLEERAVQLQAPLASYDEAWLLARRTELGEPFAALDRAGARETLRLERDAGLLDERIEAAERTAGTLEAQAGELSILRRAERRDLLEEAGSRREQAAVDLDRLGELHDVEEALRDRGGHLDDWWREHAAGAAGWVALERELIDREREREQELEPERIAEWELEQGLDAGYDIEL